MLRVATVTLLGVFVMLFVGLGESPQSMLTKLNRALSGRDYSSAFQGIIPFDRVIVSAADFSDDPEQSKCIVVVVALAPSAPATPPDRSRSRDGRFLIGGQWRKTPLQMKLASAPDLLKTCGHLIDQDTILYLEDAMEQPGNFVIRDWREGVLQIYGPTVGIAAYLSYGTTRYDRQSPDLPGQP